MSHPTSTPIAPGAQPFILPGGPVGILVIHGYGGSAGDYRTFAEALHRQGYTVSVMRVAGHGQGHIALAGAHIPDWRESVFQAGRELRQRCDRIVVLGISFGGSLAIDYAAHASGGVDGLVLVNTPIKYRGGGGLQKLLMQVLCIVRPYYAKPGLTNQDRAAYQTLGSTTHWPVRGLLETYRFISTFVLPALPRILVPVMILRSTSDPYVTAESAQQILSRLGSDNTTVVTIPGTTHRPFRQRESLDFIIQTVTRWVERIATVP